MFYILNIKHLVRSSQKSRIQLCLIKAEALYMMQKTLIFFVKAFKLVISQQIPWYMHYKQLLRVYDLFHTFQS